MLIHDIVHTKVSTPDVFVTTDKREPGPRPPVTLSTWCRGMSTSNWHTAAEYGEVDVLLQRNMGLVSATSGRDSHDIQEDESP